MLNDTVAAISTAAVDGAISIIRMSGSDALAIANRIVSFDIMKKKAIRLVMVILLILKMMRQ